MLLFLSVDVPHRRMAIVDFDSHVRKHRSLAPNRALGARIATRVH
jgi:hypothetical protein